MSSFCPLRLSFSSPIYFFLASGLRNVGSFGFFGDKTSIGVRPFSGVLEGCFRRDPSDEVDSGDLFNGFRLSCMFVGTEAFALS